MASSDPSEMGGTSYRRLSGRRNAAWIFTYLMAIVAAAVAMRFSVWVVNGGAGLTGDAVRWASEPFVYVFNKRLGMPAFSVGAGKIEVGTILALVLYAGLAVGVWFAAARGWSQAAARAERQGR